MGKGEYPELSLLLPSDPSLMAPIDQTQPKACPVAEEHGLCALLGSAFPGPHQGKEGQRMSGKEGKRRIGCTEGTVLEVC